MDCVKINFATAKTENVYKELVKVMKYVLLVATNVFVLLGDAGICSS